MLQDREAASTTADVRLTVVHVDMHDAASPHGKTGKNKPVLLLEGGKRLKRVLVRQAASVNRLRGNPRKVCQTRREMP